MTEENKNTETLESSTKQPLFIDGVVGSTDKLTESQIEHQIEMDEEEDSLWIDDDEEDEILGYECMGCGNLQNHESGFGCDVCTGHSLMAWYG